MNENKAEMDAVTAVSRLIHAVARRVGMVNVTIESKGFTRDEAGRRTLCLFVEVWQGEVPRIQWTVTCSATELTLDRFACATPDCSERFQKTVRAEPEKKAKTTVAERAMAVMRELDAGRE